MGIRIKSIGSYHPSNIVGNKEITDYFDSRDNDVRGLLKSAGRNVRHISDVPEETPLTMAIEAAKNVLDKSSTKSEEIDLIMYASDTPQYLTPCNSIFIHHELGCRHDVEILDANANCVALLTVIDMVYKRMQVDLNLNNVLLVGSQQLYHLGDVPLIKGLFGDSACAIILERTSDEVSYFIDSVTYTDSSFADKILYPDTGLTNIERKPFMNWPNPLSGRAFYHASEDIKELLIKNNVDKKSVKRYFISQMMLSEIEKISADLGEPLCKFEYIGDEYGYTGVTSPFIAMQKSIEDKKIERGDLVVFWSLGAGITEKAILLKY